MTTPRKCIKCRRVPPFPRLLTCESCVDDLVGNLSVAARTRSEAATRGWERRRRAMLTDLFWDRVDQTGGPDACWPWTGPRQTQKRRGASLYGGYGYFTVHYGRTVYAHRRALELSLGRELEEGEHALHSCDNPPCCNPAHLRAGTASDNARDMYERGRHPRTGTPGEAHPMAKLTEVDVRELRALRAAGAKPRVLARRFGIRPDHATAIGKGLAWSHVK